jgi:hypothetical protein
VGNGILVMVKWQNGEMGNGEMGNGEVGNLILYKSTDNWCIISDKVHKGLNQRMCIGHNIGYAWFITDYISKAD